MREWFLQEGWLAIAAVIVWVVLDRVNAYTCGRIRSGSEARASWFIQIRIDAIEFFIRWCLILALVVTECYLAVRLVQVLVPWFSPTRSLDHIRRFRNVGLIVIGIVTARKLTRLLLEAIASRSLKQGAEDAAERDMRVHTLASVLNGTVTTTITIAGAIMILEQFDIKTGALLAGASLAGVAVAFGSQQLLRDAFSGFFILLENQYKIGDQVKILDRTGRVEAITLRVTRLRDADGSQHIIPNGEIKAVTNMGPARP